MQEPELHDLSDDSDYAASQQKQELRSISRTASGKRTAENEPDGSEVVFWKDNVTIHPSQYASERISGRLQLIKHGSSLFMTWLPYKERSDPSGQSSDVRLSERDRNLYTIRAVPVTNIRSIRRHTPTFGWQYLIIVLSSGLAFPPLYFYNGGVREFLATLKLHAFLVRSADDVNLFIVNDAQDPLQRSLTSLELPRTGSVTNSSSTPTLASSAPPFINSERNGSSSIYQYNGRNGPKSHDPARDLSIQVLEKFSLVTKFARETTSNLLREIQNDGFLVNDKKKQSETQNDGFLINDRKKPSQSLPNNKHKTESEDVQSVPDEIVASDPHERALFRRENHCEEAATRVGAFELLNCKEVDKLTLVWGQPRRPPLGSEEWTTFLDAEGRVVDAKALRKRVFYGGLEHQIRSEVWKFLLGYYDFDSTSAERAYLASVKKEEYETMKCQWQSISTSQARRFTKFRERKALIEKDVVRTDRTISFYDGDDNSNVTILRDILLTYSFYNFDLGYCQGMSDLLSPILYVVNSESESFWCFVALMERLGPNFNRDQNGMHSQLFALEKLVELLDSPLHNYFRQNDCLNFFFCFRWVLIQFKREFDYEKMMRLWEVLWTHHLSEHFHLYVCVAILKKHRKKIMGEQMDFDTLLKFINELSGHIDLETTLRDAEALCICAGENGAALIPPGTPASLPVETGLLYPLQDDTDNDS